MKATRHRKEPRGRVRTVQSKGRFITDYFAEGKPLSTGNNLTEISQIGDIGTAKLRASSPVAERTDEQPTYPIRGAIDPEFLEIVSRCPECDASPPKPPPRHQTAEYNPVAYSVFDEPNYRSHGAIDPEVLEMLSRYQESDTSDMSSG
jgi:hypothetical protein